MCLMSSKINISIRDSAGEVRTNFNGPIHIDVINIRGPAKAYLHQPSVRTQYVVWKTYRERWIKREIVREIRAVSTT